MATASLAERVRHLRCGGYIAILPDPICERGRKVEIRPATRPASPRLAVIVKIARVPAAAVHVDPAIQPGRVARGLTRSNREIRRGWKIFGSTFNDEAIVAGRQLELEATGRNEVVFVAFVIGDRIGRRARCSREVGEVHARRNELARRAIARFDSHPAGVLDGRHTLQPRGHPRSAGARVTSCLQNRRYESSKRFMWLAGPVHT